MDFFLQYINKIPAQSHISSHSSWSFCLDVYTTADKYLEPKLSASAFDRLVHIDRSEHSIDEIFDIVEALHRDVDHNEQLVKLANDLQEGQPLELLKFDHFRAHFDNKIGSMCEFINSLAAAADETATKAKEAAENTEQKSYYLCTNNSSLVFDSPLQQHLKRCSVCAMHSGYGGDLYYPRLARISRR